MSNALEFGSVMHHGLEHQFSGSPEEVIQRTTAQYYEHRSPKCRDSTEKVALKYLLALAEVVYPRYCRYWEKDDAALTWVGREEKFALPYRIVDLDGQDRQILLRGMRDGIFSSPGIFGVFETKTMVKIVEKDIIDKLQYDMQTMLYCYCTYLSTGVYPNRIKYNVIRRPDVYKRKNEKMFDYLERVGQDIDSRPDHYFKRYEHVVTQTDLEIFQVRTLEPILRLFIQWWDSVKKNPSPVEKDGIPGRWSSPYHYLNSAALVGKYGKVEMWDAIFGDMRPYKIRSEIFPELEDCFQVTWD